VVQHARESPVAETGFPTARANTLPEVTAASEYLGLRQIFLAGDAFRGIRQILSWSRHGKALLGHAFLAQNLRHLPVGVVVSFHVMMLETRFFTFLCTRLLSGGIFIGVPPAAASVTGRRRGSNGGTFFCARLF